MARVSPELDDKPVTSARGPGRPTLHREPAMIRCAGLTKRYGAKVAVDALDLAVAPGQVYGFLGPNGAGKTTTIRMLLGLVAPSSGNAWVCGWPLPDPRVIAAVGSMIEEPAFYPWMTGRANLQVLAQAGDRGRAPEAVDQALAAVGLTDAAGQAVKTYSQGMRQRLGLAAALMGWPSLLVLDEPTNGLDPAGIHDVRRLLRGIAAEGGTVFLSSHLLAEVEQVCDRAAVLSNGRLIEEGPVANLGTARRMVRATVGPGEEAVAARALSRWPVNVVGSTLSVDHPSGRDVNAALVAAGLVAESIELVRPGLEERFLELTALGGPGVPPAPVLAPGEAG